MTNTTSVLARAALVLLLVGASCSSPPEDTAVGTSAEIEAAASAAATSAPVDDGHATENAADGGATSEPGSSTGGGKASADGGGPGRSKGRPGAKLPPAPLPVKPTVPVEAAVSPECVARGGTVVLQVETEPESAIGYQAVYSDGKGGGDAPFGAGYGGNDKGFASESGTYESTWVVSPSAPSGIGRVDVVIGYRGELGYDDPHFAVADDEGNCPEKWLREDG